MDYSALLWATVFGWLLFGTLPDVSTWVGAPMIVASGLYIVWREHRRRRQETLRALRHLDQQPLAPQVHLRPLRREQAEDEADRDVGHRHRIEVQHVPAPASAVRAPGRTTTTPRMNRNAAGEPR